jgi:hypothetical protein
VEIDLEIYGDSQVVMVQWGHGGDAVEIMTLFGPEEKASHRFNGATAVTPWK